MVDVENDNGGGGVGEVEAEGVGEGVGEDGGGVEGGAGAVWREWGLCGGVAVWRVCSYSLHRKSLCALFCFVFA
jgi:hypothetical protein